MNNTTLPFPPPIFIQNCGIHSIFHFLLDMASQIDYYVEEHNGAPPAIIYLDKNNTEYTTLGFYPFIDEFFALTFPNAKICQATSCPPDAIVLEKINKNIKFTGQINENQRMYNYIRRLLLPHIAQQPCTHSRKIYISRRDASRRKIVNDTELATYLEARGFETVVLMGLSLMEQAAIFYNAEIIIANHGCGLTNILFCQENTAIVEIPCDEVNAKRCFWDMAINLKLKNYFRYTDFTPVNWHEFGPDIIVNHFENLYSGNAL